MQAEQTMKNLDLIAFGAHPDDVELMAGGTVLKMSQRGYMAGVIDMTKGERGTRGNPETRAREARAAAKILKLRHRENLALPDAHLMVNDSTRMKVIEVLRRLRPKIVLTHFWDDPHPDHRATSQIVTDACFLAGLVKIDTGHERFRPDRVLYFMLPQRSIVQPTLVVDITRQFAAKMRAVRAYRSQLFNPRSEEPETRLSTADFLGKIEVDHRAYGQLIATRYGEGFFCREMLQVDDPVEFFSRPERSKS
jgi:bacillithiol biosynthesis deacetylase BshB1